MKSKYYLALFLTGILPVLALGGVYFWMALNQAPAPAPKSAGNGANSPAVQTSISLMESQVKTIASSMFNAVKSVHDDAPGLSAHNTDADLDRFLKSHPGVSGILVMSTSGKVEKTIPATPVLAEPSYGTSDEFQKALSKLKENNGGIFQFYTQRLSYPAFVFAVQLNPGSIAEVVMNLGVFFREMDQNSGDIFLLDAGSGNYFFHSNPAKLQTPFNPNQEPWLTKVQTDLSNKQDGTSLNPPVAAAAYAYLGFGKFGIVHVIPFSALQPPSSAPAAPAKAELDFPALFQTPMSLAILVALAWVCIVGFMALSGILAPLRKARTLVLNAAQGQGSLSEQSAKTFGGDEVGKMVQAAASLMAKLDQDRQQSAQEQEEALRRAKAQADEKARQSDALVTEAQKQAQSAKTELNEKNQLLNDKLKELDAMKGMTEGLRAQTEQAKAEGAKLKGQVSGLDQSQKEFQQKAAAAEGKIKDMEAKLLLAVSSSSPLQISQVRVAAIKTMAEELKTTLGIIKGYVSSALGTTQGGINEKQQEFLGMVINRSARLEKFINDLTDIYQVEIEQQDAKTEEINLAAEIEGLAFNFQAQAEVKNIKLKVEGKPNVPKIPIVRRRFNQLWNILYLQVIKDAPRGSSITITVEPVGDNVKVTVPDPGLVVKPESLPRLFDEFYDPKHTASAQLAGTGLKFALVKTILQAHGGGATAEKSEPGTHLILSFPSKEKKPVLATPVPSAIPGIKSPASPGGTAPGLKPPPPPMPSTVSKPLPTGGAGVLDALISGKVPPVSASPLRPEVKPLVPGVAPGLPAPGASAGAPGLKPSVPGIPSSVPPLAPPAPGLKPPASGLFDALIDKKPPVPGIPPVVPSATAPPVPSTLPFPKPAGPLPGAASAAPPVPPTAPLPKPMVPSTAPPMPSAAPKPAVIPIPGLGGLEALLDKKSIPLPTAPGLTSSPSIPGAPPVPAAPKVVPTSMKPTAPPPGILDLDNTDGFKVEGASKPAPMPPLVAPKPAGIPGAPPAGGKSIVKDLNKEGDGELIE